MRRAELGRERPPRPPAPARPPGVRAAGRGAGSLNPTARSEPTFRPPGPRAALGARQPAFVLSSQAPRSGSSLFPRPSRAGRSPAAVAPTQTTCPAPLCALPSHCLRLCGPPGALAQAQPRSGQTGTRPRPPARGPQLGRCRESQGSPRGPLACSRRSGLRGSRVLGALSSAMCPPLLLSSRSPLGPGRGASSEPCSLIRTAPA